MQEPVRRIAGHRRRSRGLSAAAAAAASVCMSECAFPRSLTLESQQQEQQHRQQGSRELVSEISAGTAAVVSRRTSAEAAAAAPLVPRSPCAVGRRSACLSLLLLLLPSSSSSLLPAHSPASFSSFARLLRRSPPLLRRRLRHSLTHPYTLLSQHSVGDEPLTLVLLLLLLAAPAVVIICMTSGFVPFPQFRLHVRTEGETEADKKTRGSCFHHSVRRVSSAFLASSSATIVPSSRLSPAHHRRCTSCPSARTLALSHTHTHVSTRLPRRADGSAAA